MSEPITLYGVDGKPVTVYGKAQADLLLAEGYSAVPPEVVAEVVSEETVSEDDVSEAPEPRRVSKRPARPGKP